MSRPTGAEPATPAVPAVPWREVFRDRERLTVGLVLLETVTAVQLLIVITVLPVVVRDLGGLRLYGWALGASALAAMIALPVTGRSADRWGPAPALSAVLGIFVVGTIVAAAAPSMPVLIAGRFLQGWGLGAQYAVSLGAIAKTYPEAHRPRILALLSGAWVVPGVVGPPIGALLATTVGWRWAFFVSLPFVVVSAWLVLPELRGIPRPAIRDAGVGVPWLLGLAVGAGAVVGGLTDFSAWSVPLALAGTALLVPVLRRILPPGSLRAARGLPAGVAASFLISFAFFGVDGFLPLLLTRARGQSVAIAGIVVTLGAVSWSLGSWWQSSVASERRRSRLAGIGTTLVLIGSAGVWLGLLRAVPLFVPYLGWTIGGLGMGIVFPTISLVVMEQAEPARQTAAISSAALAEALGASLGPGLGGAAIAIATTSGASLATGISGAFAIAMVAGALMIPVSRRLPG